MSLDRETPFGVPAKRLESPTPFAIVASDKMMFVSARPELTAIQLMPLLVERKSPPKTVPAKRFVPETTRDQTQVLVNPESTAVQLVPLFVERKMPLP